MFQEWELEMRFEKLICIVMSHDMGDDHSRLLCGRCAMALVHQRIRKLVYSIPNPTSGALGSTARLHTLKGLNHHYTVYKLFRKTWDQKLNKSKHWWLTIYHHHRSFIMIWSLFYYWQEVKAPEVVLSPHWVFLSKVWPYYYLQCISLVLWW